MSSPITYPVRSGWVRITSFVTPREYEALMMLDGLKYHAANFEVIPPYDLPNGHLHVSIYNEVEFWVRAFRPAQGITAKRLSELLTDCLREVYGP